MPAANARCAFCSAAGPLVDLPVLDEKWSRRFGGELVISLDHGWYRSASGRPQTADLPGSAKFFRPYVRAVCDYCAHGWLDDVRWRAEPAVLALAEGRDLPARPDVTSLLRWLRTTAALAELVPGLPMASSPGRRQGLRTGVETGDEADVWLFRLRQRLPARVHLSQVAVQGEGADELVQLVSVDISHLTAVLVLPSDSKAAGAVARSRLNAEFGPALTPTADLVAVHTLDLANTPLPHRIAVHRVCGVRSPPSTV